MGRPDAVRVPNDGTISFHDHEGIANVVGIAEQLLECGPLELAWCHPQTGYCFCTRDPHDLEQFPDTHRQARQPRYHWVTRPDGTELGYLMSGQGPRLVI